jgi:hypothetical protein
MATINYWGLTGVKRSVTGITLTTATVDTLITAIATDEGLPADYYNWSLLNSPGKNSIVYGDSTTKLSAIGVVDGDTVVCTPQQNETKQERQVRKLEIAQIKRKGFGDTTKPYYRVNNTYDITLLPDTYATAADDNPNTGGLLNGRPWVSTVSIRSLLSASGKTAYDAASADSFFAVSSTDWDAVFNGVASTSKLGVGDTEFTGASGSPFSANYLLTFPQAGATVPANNYIIGFRANTGYINQQWKIYGGTTYKSTSPAYSQISTSSPSTGGTTGRYYYLRKAPVAQASTTYIAVTGTQTITMNSGTTYAGSAYSASPYTSWTAWSSVMPQLQVIITPTAVV